MLDTSFRNFYKNASDSLILENSEGVIKHLTHLEELILTSKEEGLNMALSFLRELYDIFKGKTISSTFVSVKIDGCIHPETKVVTERGSQTIESIITQINAGQDILVYGFDFTENKTTLTNISYARSGIGSKSWVEIELENGDLFRCTEDHEVYTENRGWIQAKNLTVDDELKYLAQN